jgi:calreticulin
MVDNSEYKGTWKPKQAKNPKYKGKWIHPEIDNPEYQPDDELYLFKDFGSIGIDIWVRINFYNNFGINLKL